MMKFMLLPAFAAALVLSGPALADRPPPPDAKPLSEVVRMLEATGDVVFIDEVDWEDTHWEIEYVSKAGGKKKVRLDPVTGQPRK